LGVVLWFANQYVVPRANKIRSSFESKYIDANSSYNALVGGNTNIYFRVDSFTYAGIIRYDTLTKRGGPIFMYRLDSNRLTHNLRAEGIVWDTAIRKWRLESLLSRQFNQLGEKVTLQDYDNRTYNFTPQDLGRDKYTKERLTTPELNRFIELETLRGSEGLNDLKVERYRRDATSVTVILLTLIGAIVAGRKVRGGSGLHLAIGFMLAALFIITDRFSTIFSTKGSLPPLLAAWIPNAIFIGVVILLYRKAPK
jgi:lipopolysaccharide export system permease protein